MPHAGSICSATSEDAQAALRCYSEYCVEWVVEIQEIEVQLRLTRGPQKRSPKHGRYCAQHGYPDSAQPNTPRDRAPSDMSTTTMTSSWPRSTAAVKKPNWRCSGTSVQKTKAAREKMWHHGATLSPERRGTHACMIRWGS